VANHPKNYPCSSLKTT